MKVFKAQTRIGTEGLLRPHTMYLNFFKQINVSIQIIIYIPSSSSLFYTNFIIYRKKKL